MLKTTDPNQLLISTDFIFLMVGMSGWSCLQDLKGQVWSKNFVIEIYTIYEQINERTEHLEDIPLCICLLAVCLDTAVIYQKF